MYKIDKKIYSEMLVNSIMEIRMSKSINYKGEKEVEKEEGRKGKKERKGMEEKEGGREGKQKMERSFIFKFYHSLM